MPFLNDLKITPLSDGKRWMVLDEFKYYSPLIRECISIPKGFVTDFASIPRLPLTWIVGSPATGKYRRAAVVHDYLYFKKETDRDICDKVFREAMEEDNTPSWKKNIVYSAVRLFGKFYY